MLTISDHQQPVAVVWRDNKSMIFFSRWQGMVTVVWMYLWSSALVMVWRRSLFKESFGIFERNFIGWGGALRNNSTWFYICSFMTEKFGILIKLCWLLLQTLVTRHMGTEAITWKRDGLVQHTHTSIMERDKITFLSKFLGQRWSEFNKCLRILRLASRL